MIEPIAARIAGALALLSCLGLVGSAPAAPPRPRPRPAVPAALPMMGFYVPWDPASLESLQRHGAALAWIVPGWIYVHGRDHAVTDSTDGQAQAAIAALPHRPMILPMVQNAYGGHWYGRDTAALLRDPAARTTLIGTMIRSIETAHADGMTIDLEDLPEAAQPDLLALLAEARARFAPRRWQIAIAVPVADDSWDLAAVARIADHVVLMAYDEHEQGGAPGPIASLPWFRDVVARALRIVPADRAVVAVASYAYDWAAPGSGSASSIAHAQEIAVKHHTAPRIDPASGNAHFAYVDADGRRHHVWMVTASAVADQMAAARAAGARKLALWRLGTEDPAMWDRR